MEQFNRRMAEIKLENAGVTLDTVVKCGNDPFCPRCNDFDEGEPLTRYGWRGEVGEREWKEIHRCPICGQKYEYNNGDA